MCTYIEFDFEYGSLKLLKNTLSLLKILIPIILRYF